MSARRNEGEAREALTQLGLRVPEVGSRWHWQPGLPHASVVCVVTGTFWNGEEFWINSRPEDRPDRPEIVGNDLQHWFQSAVLLGEVEP